MKPNIGLSDAQREGNIAILSALLADEYVLYTKTRNYHWNVTGPHFNDLHKFFESQYDSIDEKIDEIAEFIRSLGGKSPGSLAEFVKSARLRESKGGESATQMVENLLADHEAVVRQLRGDIAKAGDKFKADDVADFLTGLAEDHQKMAWMLRSIAE
jgi:starvation-inducible DNA-binding protein